MLQVNSAQSACQVMLPQAEAVAMFAETTLIAVTPVEHAFKPLITTMVFGTAGWIRHLCLRLRAPKIFWALAPEVIFEAPGQIR
jgi:hypothetical protein